jgi:hypothetical protein
MLREAYVPRKNHENREVFIHTNNAIHFEQVHLRDGGQPPRLPGRRMADPGAVRARLPALRGGLGETDHQ